jgi:tRNA(Arg) A34 adenosine deaminase TadA
MNNLSAVTLTLPSWLSERTAGPLVLPDPLARMAFVIELSRLNVEHRSGGPFAAAVFESRSGRLLGAGVNRVEPLNCSPAHAEVLAVAFAQRQAGSYDLGTDRARATELLTSSQPCLMCLGAVLWSGVTRLVYGATASDVQGILGFDEGPLPAAWEKELAGRGITVEAGTLRREAATVLELYKAEQGKIYNSRQSF